MVCQILLGVWKAQQVGGSLLKSGIVQLSNGLVSGQCWVTGLLETLPLVRDNIYVHYV